MARFTRSDYWLFAFQLEDRGTAPKDLEDLTALITTNGGPLLTLKQAEQVMKLYAEIQDRKLPITEIVEIEPGVRTILYRERYRKVLGTHPFLIQERFNVLAFAEQFQQDLIAYGTSGVADIQRTSTGFVFAWTVNGLDTDGPQNRPKVKK